MRDRAEEYMQQQRTQRETLDELRISCQRFLQDNHVVKIIEEKEDRIEQLNQAVKMELDSSPLKGFQDVDLVASELNIKRGVGVTCLSGLNHGVNFGYCSCIKPLTQACSVDCLDLYNFYKFSKSKFKNSK